MGRLFPSLTVLRVRNILLISSLYLFLANSDPFVLVPTLFCSLNSFSPSLVFTTPDELIESRLSLWLLAVVPSCFHMSCNPPKQWMDYCFRKVSCK